MQIHLIDLYKRRKEKPSSVRFEPMRSEVTRIRTGRLRGSHQILQDWTAGDAGAAQAPHH